MTMTTTGYQPGQRVYLFPVNPPDGFYGYGTEFDFSPMQNEVGWLATRNPNGTWEVLSDQGLTLTLSEQEMEPAPNAGMRARDWTVVAIIGFAILLIISTAL